MAETTYSDRMRHPSAQPAEGFGSQLTTLRNTMSPWWFLLPALAFFIGYQAYPIFRVLWISFTSAASLRNPSRAGIYAIRARVGSNSFVARLAIHR